jgi:hypothetical protein
MTCRLACDVGERVGRIGDGNQYRLRRGTHYLWNDVAIDGGIFVK